MIWMLDKQVTSILKSECIDLRKLVSNDCYVFREFTGFDLKVDNVHFGEKD